MYLVAKPVFFGLEARMYYERFLSISTNCGEENVMRNILQGDVFMGLPATDVKFSYGKWVKITSRTSSEGTFQ